MPVYDITARRSAFGRPAPQKKRREIPVQQILDEISDAESERNTMMTDVRALYDLTMPNRQAFDGQQPGQPRQPRDKYASEPVRAMRKGSGVIADAMVPAQTEWCEYVPGPGVPKARRESMGKATEHITKQVFSAVRASRYGAESRSMAYEVMASTGFMRIGVGDRMKPFKVRAYPFHQCCPVPGPEGEIRTNHIKSKVRLCHLVDDYPMIRLTPRLSGLYTKNERTEVEIIEATYYDRDAKAWRPCVIDPDSRTVMDEDEPEPVSPWITPRLSYTPGNVFGAGFGLDALPAIRVLNAQRETSLLAGARIGRPPFLMATETGLNPNTIRLSPNAMGMVNLTGLAALGGKPPFWALPTGDPQWNELSSEQLIGVIDDILLATPIVGPLEDIKNVTAFAASVRKNEMLLDRGVNLETLINEWPLQSAQRFLWIMSKLGKLENVDRELVVDGETLAVEAKGPLALAQQSARVNGTLSFVANLRATLGDQATTLGIKVEDVAARMAEEQPGFDNSLIRDEEERAQMQANAAQIAAAEMTQGGPGLAPIQSQGLA
jgi:hypothetical protein